MVTPGIFVVEDNPQALVLVPTTKINITKLKAVNWVVTRLGRHRCESISRTPISLGFDRFLGSGMFLESLHMLNWIQVSISRTYFV